MWVGLSTLALAAAGYSGLLGEIPAPARANHFAGEDCLS